MKERQTAPYELESLIQPVDRTQRALRPIIFVSIAVAVVSVALTWELLTIAGNMALAVQIGVLLLLLPLVQSGRVRTAAWLATTAMLVGCTTVVWSYGSMRSIASIGFPFAVVIAAIFLRRREMAVVIVAAWVCVAVLTWRESTLAAVVPRPFGWRQAVMFDLVVLLAGLVVGYARTLASSAVGQMRAELHERERAEERLRLSMEATRQGWFELDVVTGEVRSSEHFQRIMGAAGGMESRPLTHDAWVAAIHRADRPAVLERFGQCLRSGETEQMEYRLMGLDGVFRWIRSTAKVVERDEHGRPLRLAGTHADITDQRTLTLVLEAGERSYRALVEMSPVGVVVLREGLVRYANPAALAMLGATACESVVGMEMQRFVPDGSVPHMADVLAATGHDGVVGEPYEHPLYRLDGERFDASIRCTAVVYEGNPSLQFSFTDISSQKQAEEARLRSRQLEALGTLAGGIAHDFNNILFAIRGNAELVAGDAALPESSADSIKEILAAGKRASELIRRITAFSQPKEARPDRLYLSAVLDEVLRLLRPTVPAGISMVVDASGDMAPILADAAQVHETILNLTTNAVYAIGHSRVGQVHYAIDTVQLDGEAARIAGVKDGRYSRLSVRDTGRGMDADTQRRAFDAFFTTKPVGEGSGLGLSMAYSTMRSHGGAITVESLPGAGATFRLLFPVAGTDEMVAPAVPAEARPSGAAPLRVMFVDDEPQIVRMAHRTLTRLGHEVVTFNDPVAALEQFRATPDAFDVVVTDLSMPNMSGLDLARAVRETPSPVPIVMVTGFADDADEAEAYAAGVTRLAVKAADAQQLSRLLAQVAPGV